MILDGMGPRETFQVHLGQNRITAPRRAFYLLLNQTERQRLLCALAVCSFNFATEMVSTVALFGNSAFAIPKIFSVPARFIGFKVGASLQEDSNQKLPSIVLDSLRVLEWDKVCDSVASFAGTSLGKKATKVLCSPLYLNTIL